MELSILLFQGNWRMLRVQEQIRKGLREMIKGVSGTN
jgi:hypothetical protein